MHDQLLNHQVANLRHGEIERSHRRARPADLEPKTRIAVGRHFVAAVRTGIRRAAWQAPSPRTTGC